MKLRALGSTALLLTCALACSKGREPAPNAGTSQLQLGLGPGGTHEIMLPSPSEIGILFDVESDGAQMSIALRFYEQTALSLAVGDDGELAWTADPGVAPLATLDESWATDAVAFSDSGAVVHITLPRATPIEIPIDVPGADPTSSQTQLEGVGIDILAETPADTAQRTITFVSVRTAQAGGLLGFIAEAGIAADVSPDIDVLFTLDAQPPISGALVSSSDSADRVYAAALTGIDPTTEGNYTLVVTAGGAQHTLTFSVTPRGPEPTPGPTPEPPQLTVPPGLATHALSRVLDYITVLRIGEHAAIGSDELRSDDDVIRLAANFTRRFRQIQGDLQRYRSLFVEGFPVGGKSDFLAGGMLYIPAAELLPYLDSDVTAEASQALLEAQAAGIDQQIVQALLHPAAYCAALRKWQIKELIFGERSKELLDGQEFPDDPTRASHFAAGVYANLGSITTLPFVQTLPTEGAQNLKAQLDALLAAEGVGPVTDICQLDGGGYLEPLMVPTADGDIDPWRAPMVLQNKDGAGVPFAAAFFDVEPQIVEDIEQEDLFEGGFQRWITLGVREQLHFVATLAVASGATADETAKGLAWVLWLNHQDAARYAQALAWFSEVITRSADHTWLTESLPLPELALIAPSQGRRTIRMLLTAVFASLMRHPDPASVTSLVNDVLDAATGVHASVELLDWHFGENYRDEQGLAPGHSFVTANPVLFHRPEAFPLMAEERSGRPDIYSGPLLFARQYHVGGNPTDRTDSLFKELGQENYVAHVEDPDFMTKKLAVVDGADEKLKRQYFLFQTEDPDAATVYGCNDRPCQALPSTTHSSLSRSLDELDHLGLPDGRDSLGPIYDPDSYRNGPGLDELALSPSNDHAARHRPPHERSVAFQRLFDADELVYTPMPPFSEIAELLDATVRAWDVREGGTMTASQISAATLLFAHLQTRLQDAQPHPQLSDAQRDYLQRFLDAMSPGTP